MNKNYFEGCTTQAEAKARYRELVRQHHPDAGGDTATMQDINAAYAQFLANSAKTEAKTRQQSAHAAGKKSAADYHDMDEVSQKIYEVINFAVNLEGVEVELMGLWVWLSGNTKAHKETFKQWNEGKERADRLQWSPTKKAWYFAGVPSFGRKGSTLDEIRNTYGSQRFTRQEEERAPMAGALQHG